MNDDRPSSRPDRPTPKALPGLTLDIDVEDGSLGEARALESALAAAVQAALSAGLSYADAPMELSVRIVGDDESQALNRDYRGKDKPTNVLSFPGEEPDDLPASLRTAATGGPPVMLGDLVIAGPVLVREARAQGKSEADHLAHLAVHGVLHLIGYDHIDEAEADEMEALEADILSGMGIADPYQVEHDDE